MSLPLPPIAPYCVLWIVAIPIGAMATPQPLWLVANVMNGFIAVPT
ncbi:hypothetical protein [Nitrobacter winogradskyi]|uniref:Na+/alanine symporter n=2 Tax=Nitrobacter winogradskyi TaxID=913 RepID=A0ACC6AL04_NITWI|nr:hypothetical protein [Nitrobacter winogradskyi]MCP1999650.1 Na+/alanine symporter [Nitrobacter winogradskyi]GEC17495.1 hypothetical protein NWI01_33870 [Nitrobacter winogradskyi]